MITTVIILLISAALFVSGKVRSDLVALCALLALLLFQILVPSADGGRYTERMHAHDHRTVRPVYKGKGNKCSACGHISHQVTL